MYLRTIPDWIIRLKQNSDRRMLLYPRTIPDWIIRLKQNSDRRMLLYPRTVTQWNEHPQELMAVTTLACFKSGFASHLKNCPPPPPSSSLHLPFPSPAPTSRLHGYSAPVLLHPRYLFCYYQLKTRSLSRTLPYSRT